VITLKVVVGPLYPINLLLDDKTCLVVGGGQVALAKTQELLRCQAQVRLVAPEICQELRDMAADQTEHNPAAITLREDEYRPQDLDGCFLVIAATGDVVVNQQVFDDARRLGILANSADDPQRCDFFLPARLRLGDLLLTVSTGGQSPAMASWLRRKLEQDLGVELAKMLEMVSEVRQEVKSAGVSTESLDWQGAFDSGIFELVKAGQITEAKEQLRRWLAK